jgi:hypothetical protein
VRRFVTARVGSAPTAYPASHSALCSASPDAASQ